MSGSHSLQEFGDDKTVLSGVNSNTSQVSTLDVSKEKRSAKKKRRSNQKKKKEPDGEAEFVKTVTRLGFQHVLKNPDFQPFRDLVKQMFAVGNGDLVRLYLAP